MSSMIFQRYEIKYLLSVWQYQSILPVIKEYMEPDMHGKSTIQSLYFDTEDSLLIRRSLEKPAYKEKLRLRSYGLVKDKEAVFLEIKKKSDGIVYKRRISLTEEEAQAYIYSYNVHAKTQIGKEIAYFKRLYCSLRPVILLIYDRMAFCENTSDLRITFDSNIRYRRTDLSLTKGLYGTRLLDEKQILMEVKTGRAIPLWLSHLLCQNQIFKTSFSKYGEAYKRIKNKIKEEELWKNFSAQYFLAQK